MDKNKYLFYLLMFIVCQSSSAFAIELKYAYKTGQTYEYELEKSDISRTVSHKSNFEFKKPAEKTIFSVKTIDFQENAFILDIRNDQGTFRRYIKENGELKGAPGEAGQPIPFFLILPDDDWKLSEKKLVSKNLTIGSTSVPMAYNMQLIAIDKEKNLAEIAFAAQMRLPEDKMRKKKFLLKGKAFFNLSEGVMQSGEWTVSYGFNFVNREMAVSRNIWNFEKQTTMSLNLKAIKE